MTHLESSSSLGIVLEVENGAIQLVEQLSTNPIVSTLAEVHAIFEVTATQVDSDSHIVRTISDAVVIKFNVGVENRFRVDSLGLHTSQHIFRALL